ncbi:unnamed protein product [Haemonchus placei]|uniref:WW domain-containing protein n=1 Tax=Haemonchus placei TaxID=6290 RepID=A0A158QM50_HAEPC|nr:unnamed protein product [Haemonchus placei]
MLLGSGSIVALLSFAHAQYQPPAPKPPPPTIYVPSLTLPPYNPAPFPPSPPGPPGPPAIDYGPPTPPVYQTTRYLPPPTPPPTRYQPPVTLIIYPPKPDLPPSVPDIPTNEYVQFNSKEDDTQWYSPTNSKRVAKVQSTMDAGSQCIEDYCGY